MQVFFLAFNPQNSYNVIMDEEKLCFAAIEFVDDPNVAGYFYWYISPLEGIKEGDKVIAPLGRHNNLQEGIVRKVRYDFEYNAPYPLHSIKSIRSFVKRRFDVQDS